MILEKNQNQLRDVRGLVVIGTVVIVVVMCWSQNQTMFIIFTIIVIIFLAIFFLHTSEFFFLVNSWQWRFTLKISNTNTMSVGIFDYVVVVITQITGHTPLQSQSAVIGHRKGHVIVMLLCCGGRGGCGWSAAISTVTMTCIHRLNFNPAWDLRLLRQRLVGHYWWRRHGLGIRWGHVQSSRFASAPRDRGRGH